MEKEWRVEHSIKGAKVDLEDFPQGTYWNGQRNSYCFQGTIEDIKAKGFDAVFTNKYFGQEPIIEVSKAEVNKTTKISNMTKYYVIGYSEGNGMIDGKPHVVSEDELQKAKTDCKDATDGNWFVVVITEFEVNQI